MSMVLSIVDQAGVIGKVSRKRIESILFRRLGALSARVSKGRVSLRDINGPRGGIDKECMIRLNLIDAGSLIVKGRAESLGKAFSIASKKLSRVAKRRAAKKRSRKMNRRIR